MGRPTIKIKPLTESPYLQSAGLSVREAVLGDAPDFVEEGEAGIAVEDSMRHLRCLQLVGEILGLMSCSAAL